MSYTTRPEFWGEGRKQIWPGDRPEYESMSAAVQGEAARHNVPGIAIGILQDGHIDVAVAGFANLESKRPVTPNTLFQIGSITKVFTATLVQQLVQEGLLDLDEPVKTYLPDFKLADTDAEKTITLRHLLSHTSGIEGDYFEDLGLGDDAVATAVSRFDTLKQWNAPGELWAYCNSGFYLTARIIEVMTGKTYEAVLQEKLLTPLGTPDITAHTYDVIVRDHSVSYNLNDRGAGHVLADPFAFSRQVTAAGNLMAPVNQLLRFAQLHLGEGEIEGKRLLSSNLAKEMRVVRPVTTDTGSVFGVGWAVRPVGGEFAITHNGGTNGQRALLIVLPNRGFAVAVLTNGSRGDRAHNALAEWAVQRYRGIKPTPPAEPVELPMAQLRRWAGIWERHDRHIEFELRGEILVGSTFSIESRVTTINPERTEFELEPLSETTFRIKAGDFQGVVLEFIELDPDARGNYRALVRFGSRLAERYSKPEAETESKPSRRKKS